MADDSAVADGRGPADAHSDDELSPDELAWRGHFRRAGHLLGPQGLPDFTVRTDSPFFAGQFEYVRDWDAHRAWRALVAASPPDVLGSFLLVLVLLATRDDAETEVSELVPELIDGDWSVTAADARLAAEMCLRAGWDQWHTGFALLIAERMLRRTAAEAPGGRADPDLVRSLVRAVEGMTCLLWGHRVQLRERLVDLLPRADGEVRIELITPTDHWSSVVLRELRQISAAPEDLNALLAHLAAATGSKPTQVWSRRTAELLAIPGLAHLVMVMLAGLGAADPDFGLDRGERVLDECNATIARGAAWAAGVAAPPWAVEALSLLIPMGIRRSGYESWSGGDKVTNAAIWSLGRNATPEAIVALRGLLDRVRHNGFRKLLQGALREAATRSGATPAELLEQGVPTGGLDGDGTRLITAGEITARATLTDALTVRVEWQSGADWLSRVPAGYDKRDVGAVQRQVKEIRDLVGLERRRLESLLSADRSWPVERWKHYYLDHPVTGRIARGLIWEYDDGGGTPVAGLPTSGAGVSGPSGERTRPENGTVRLWHPLRATTGVVGEWRDWLVESGRVQPFKQAFREIYLLTAAERDTVTSSNRFAGHVVRYPQFYALGKERGWVANFLGSHSSGREGRARKDIAGCDITIVFDHVPIGFAGGAARVEMASTDQVWFHRTSDRRRTPVELVEVPDVAFSEGMRDVDLFVAVTSIALDPLWADRFGHAQHPYWLRASFAELTSTAQVRRDILARLLPRLGVAERLELADRYVRVRGNRASYKVHIGSANVLIEPDDRYLCIVPAGVSATLKRVMLPFEGDQVLAVVLSKIVLLAADDKITDHSILAQLPAR